MTNYRDELVEIYCTIIAVTDNGIMIDNGDGFRDWLPRQFVETEDSYPEGQIGDDTAIQVQRWLAEDRELI